MIDAVAGGSGGWGRAWPGLVGSGAFGATFLLLSWGLRSDELLLIAGPVARRLRKKPAA